MIEYEIAKWNRKSEIQDRFKIIYILWSFILYSEMMWWGFHNEVYFGFKNKLKTAFLHYEAELE